MSRGILGLLALALALAPALGQPRVVENRAGAQGGIGLQAAKNSPADGYTFIYTNVSNIFLSPHMVEQLPYDRQKDFAPVTQLSVGPHLASGRLVALAWAGAQAADPLPALAADAAAVTVSGVSSGGYMAVQLHVAHSGVVRGAGVIAGGPYYCAQASVRVAYYNCMTPSDRAPLPDPALLAAQAVGLARTGRIDAISNLASAKVWLFSGRSDRVVFPEVVVSLKEFYRSVGVKPSRIRFVSDRPAGHAMVTEDAGNACGATASPYLNDCDYDAAGELLKFLLGELKSPSGPSGGRLVKFDQVPFASGDAYAISMADEGYLYVPRACDAGGCRVHVAFHGCRQGAEAIGERFVREAGYNRWADANRLVVLYPQAIARYGWSFGRWNYVMNPRGCWDWWGYTGPEYHTKAGAQVRAVKAMLERLAQSPR